jgi:hypothetical protein
MAAAAAILFARLSAFLACWSTWSGTLLPEQVVHAPVENARRIGDWRYMKQIKSTGLATNLRKPGTTGYQSVQAELHTCARTRAHPDQVDRDGSKFVDFAHVLIGKPVPTFPGHALASANRFRPALNSASKTLQRQCRSDTDPSFMRTPGECPTDR